MRWVSIPDELAVPHLLELREATAPLIHTLHGEVSAKLLAGDWPAALELVERAFALAWSGHDRYAAALMLLYKAELFSQRQRWEEALEQSTTALDWLRLQISEVARYNEAVAAYQQGLLHYTLRADEKATRLLLNAQELFLAGERYWGLRGDAERVGECRDVQRWISRLLELQVPTEAMVPALIVPLYELENRTFIRAWAIAVAPLCEVDPAGLQPVAGSALIPLTAGPAFLLQLLPGVRYAAFWAHDAPDLVSESQPGDILLVEMEAAGTAGTGGRQGRGGAFVRRPDGRIAFHLQRPATPRLAGIPRALLRGREVAR